MRNNKGKTFIITSAQAFASANKDLLSSIDHYASRTAAEVIVLPMIGKNAKEDNLVENLDDVLMQYDVESSSRLLNNNIGIDQFDIRPYQINPLTGLSRFIQRGTTKVFASPKQFIKYVPHSNSKTPKGMFTTGAVTFPNYATGRDVSAERRRLGNIAKRDHVYGFLVVEVQDSNTYHVRNVRAQKNGKFHDLRTLYDGDSVSDSPPLAMVAGDWHNGYTNKQARKGTMDMIAELQPEVLVLHDFFNGHSVSHHMQKQLIEQMIKEGADKKHLSLERELQQGYKELVKIDEAMGGRDVVLVACNHHEFLNRYLDEGRFIKDPVNARLAFDIAHAYANGADPVEYGIRMMGDLPANVRFLRRDEDFKIQGYQLGAHGDKGPNGGRGSARSKELDWGKSITGHIHTSTMFRDTHMVGTLLPITPFYMKGQPTGFTNTNALLTSTGVQHINIIKGSYRSKHVVND